MNKFAIGLSPSAESPPGAGVFERLQREILKGHAFASVALEHSRHALELMIDGGRGALVQIPPAQGIEETVEIAPGHILKPCESERILAFLATASPRLDHIGINLSKADVSATDWKTLINALGAIWPAYRLNIGSPNDIVLLIDQSSADPSVVELVHDRAAQRTSLHFCLKVNLERKPLAEIFPAPHGGYKPGDEAFFRSVALPRFSFVPAYLDLAFSDAPIAPWPKIAAQMGQRL